MLRNVKVKNDENKLESTKKLGILKDSVAIKELQRSVTFGNRSVLPM